MLNQSNKLRHHIQDTLENTTNLQPPWDDDTPIGNGLSVVLLLVSMYRFESGREPEPCIILNKRSQKVRQPGDICCPGGGIMPRFDRFAAHLLRLPYSPLRQWDHYSRWAQRAPQSMSRLGLLLATALREGMEEMRLNPLGVVFQGMLPPEQLVMFNRIIYPLVGWVKHQQRFFPNWEVAHIVRIPVRDLLVPDNYIGLRLIMSSNDNGRSKNPPMDFPAFQHRTDKGLEILWGATFRITMNFLDRVFDFSPPPPDNGVIIEKRLTEHYITGRG